MRDIEIEEKLNELFENGLFSQHEIVLFGANNASLEMFQYLRDKGCTVVAVIDNNQGKWGQKLANVPVYSPEEFMNPYSERYVILIVSQYANEMKAQLLKYGYEENVQVFVVKKLFRKYDTSLDAFQFFEKKIRRGQEVYRRFFTDKSTDPQMLFVCPYVGNGDIYLLGQFLTTYLEKHGITEYVVTVVGNVCRKISEMFHWRNVTVLTQEESDNLIAYARFVGLEQSKVMILNDCYQLPVVRRFRGYQNIDFYKMFQTVVFHLEHENLYNQETCLSQAEVADYIQQYQLERGKSVILAPYANTTSAKIDLENWKKVADYYSQKGFRVFTNGMGEKEPPISGTTRISAPFNAMKAIVEYAGTFVGLRSGLCDIVAGSNAEMIILYPSAVIGGTTSFYDYFSLKKMGMTTSVTELEYSDELFENWGERINENGK